jgi:hypothetical protein
MEISENIREAGVPVHNSLRPEAQEIQESAIDTYMPGNQRKHKEV